MIYPSEKWIAKIVLNDYRNIMNIFISILEFLKSFDKSVLFWASKSKLKEKFRHIGISLYLGNGKKYEKILGTQILHTISDNNKTCNNNKATNDI